MITAEVAVGGREVSPHQTGSPELARFNLRIEDDGQSHDGEDFYRIVPFPEQERVLVHGDVIGPFDCDP